MGRMALDSFSLTLYIREMGKPRYNPLPQNEEEKLAHSIQTGNRRALDTLVSANMRFVIAVAQHYRYVGVSFEDLIASGNEGLVMAAQQFDASKHIKFISYAVWRIRKKMLDLIARQARCMAIPQKLSSMLLPAAQHLRATYEQQHEGYICSQGVLSYVLDISDSTLTDIDRAVDMRKKSLDIPRLPGEDDPMVETITYEDMGNEEGAYEDFPLPNGNVAYMLALKLVNRILASCPRRDAVIIRLYFGFGHRRSYSTLEIGKKLHISHQRVSQILEQRICLCRKRHC